MGVKANTIVQNPPKKKKITIASYFQAIPILRDFTVVTNKDQLRVISVTLTLKIAFFALNASARRFPSDVATAVKTATIDTFGRSLYFSSNSSSKNDRRV